MIEPDHDPPAELTWPDLVQLFERVPVPPKYENNDLLYEVEGPRMFATGLLPCPSPEGEIHGLLFRSKLLLVSKKVFGIL